MASSKRFSRSRVGSDLGALALYETRDIAVQIELGPVDLEVHRMGNALGEYLAGHPLAIRLPLGEIDHRLLGAAQQETDPRELQQMVVDGGELMGERIDTRDGQPEVRVKLPSDTEGVGLQTQSQELGVTVETTLAADD